MFNLYHRKDTKISLQNKLIQPNHAYPRFA